MEEILIGEKKYVSSKQAAKLTGYAKDYIGQLCREGRVPARLVGRSWYVLESAIHDHRFGKLESEGVDEQRPQKTFISSAWDSPRYEAVLQEEINPIQHHEAIAEGDSLPDEGLKERLHDSWKAWFDRVVEAAPPSSSNKTVEGNEPTAGNREVNIPLRAVQRVLPPDELLPHRKRSIGPGGNEGFPEEFEMEDEVKPKNRLIGNTVLVVGVLLAACAASVAAINSGSFDGYEIFSDSQASVISGIIGYKK